MNTEGAMMTDEPNQHEPLQWVIPVSDSEDVEMQVLSALTGVMNRPEAADLYPASLRRIADYFSSRYGGGG